MHAKIQRWGNSLGLRIPKSFAQEAGVEEGSAVDLTIEGRNLVIRPESRRYSFRSLVRAITGENMHEPIDDGGPVGRLPPPKAADGSGADGRVPVAGRRPQERFSLR